MTPQRLEFHPEAIDEAEAAYRWYGGRSSIAAERFFDELEHGLQAIIEGPERWPPFTKLVRRYLFRRFPYMIVYRIADDVVIVLAVAHASRRPGYWRKRI